MEIVSISLFSISTLRLPKAILEITTLLSILPLSVRAWAKLSRNAIIPMKAGLKPTQSKIEVRKEMVIFTLVPSSALEKRN